MRLPLLPLPVLLAALLPLASATIFMTNPTASSTLAAGKALSITWLVDPDSTSPKAKDFGAVSLGLYTGSSTQQTLLQTLGNVTDPTKVLKLAVKVDPTVGPDSSFYFVRIQSLAAKDTAGAPLQAFSARFALTKMNGTFTAAENAQNAGINSLTPVVGNSSVVTGSAVDSSSSAIQTAGMKSSSSSGGSSVTAKNATSASGTTSGAEGVSRGKVGRVVASVVGAVVLGGMVL